MLDLSAINISLPEAPDLSLGNLMSGIKIQASGDDVSNLAAALLKGYQEYAKEHPEADYSGLGENFIGYLNTEKAQEILKNNIKDIIESSGSVEVSKEELQMCIRDRPMIIRWKPAERSIENRLQSMLRDTARNSKVSYVVSTVLPWRQRLFWKQKR